VTGVGCTKFCSPGEYKNTTDDSTCSPCPKGTYGQTSGQSRCDTCPIGRYNGVANATACVDCVAGKFSSQSGQTDCSLCPTGRYSNGTSRSTCDQCKQGKYQSKQGFTYCDLCSPGQFNDQFGNFRCFSCNAGKYSENVGNLACTPCPKGKYGDVNQMTFCYDCSYPNYSTVLGSTACLSCLPGTTPVNTTSECSGCVLGKFLPFTNATFCLDCPQGKQRQSIGMSNCTDCEPGRIALDSRTECGLCAVGKYASNFGSSTCQSCGSGSISLLNGASSISSCVCPAGFYGKPFVEGGNCQACFAEEICRINTTFRVYPAGYYRLSENSLQPCSRAEICLESTEADSTTICAEGYTGEMCSSCMPRTHFRFKGACQKCGNELTKWIAFVIVVFLISFFLVRLSKSQGRIPADVRIAFHWLQFIATFPNVSKNWPRSLTLFLKIISISNLDIDLVSPECSFVLDWWSLFHLKMLCPFIFLIVCLIGISLHLCTGKRQTTFLHFLKILLRTAVMIFMLLFTYVSVTLASSIPCIRYFDGSYRMYIANDVKCFDSKWWKNLPSIVFYFLLYGIGIPGMFVYLFFKYRKEPENPNYSYINELVVLYKSEYHLWDMFLLVRKVIFSVASCVLPVFFSIFVKKLSVFMLMSTFLVIDVTHMPHRFLLSNQCNIL
jgi:hypothetical protein